ncbi:MAG: ATP-binding protein [Pseudomonadota bacterium]|nr:ATP-binding protein [Pseudomonadota bacterium]
MQQRSTLCDFAQLFTQYVARSGAKYSELAQKTQISRHTLYRWRDGKCRQPDKARLRRCFKPLQLTEEEANKLLLAAGYSPDNLFPALFQQALPSKEEPLSPFVVGPPITQPQQFYGRQQETRRILKLWQQFPLSNVAVFGQQRSGKTSFLYYLRHQLHSCWIQLPKTSLNYRIILIDFKDARMQYPTSLLAYLLKQLHLPVPEPCHLLNFAETVDNQPLDKPTIILMDDIDVGLNAKALDQTFWWGLYHFMNNMAGRVAFLLTAHPDSSQLLQEKAKTLSFFNTFSHHLTLGPLIPEEAEALIERAPLAFSAKDKAWIMKHSGHWPALLQILCERRLNALEEGDDSDTWKKNFLYIVE